MMNREVTPSAHRRSVGSFGLRFLPVLTLVFVAGCAPYDPDLFTYRALTLGRRLLVQGLGFAMFG
jgi:hypothetical protein